MAMSLTGWSMSATNNTGRDYLLIVRESRRDMKKRKLPACKSMDGAKWPLKIPLEVARI